MTDAIVYQYGRSYRRNGTEVMANKSDLDESAPPNSGAYKPPVLRAYKMHDIFPTNVSQIDLSYDTSDTIEEFTVEFQVNWFEIEDKAKADGRVGSNAPNGRIT